MLILALEAASKSASCCLYQDGEILAQSYQLSGLTHSRTLLPMVEDMLKNCETDLSQVDAVAVSHGPGSFTGVRIGVAAAKGLAWAKDLPCLGVSTLEAMAAPLAHLEGADICCCMDARRQQVYSARFHVENGRLRRLTDDGAIAISDLAAEIEKNSRGVTQILVGDGWRLCYNSFGELGIPCAVAPEPLRYPTAYGVALCAAASAASAPLPSAAEVVPAYHRLSQAERERNARLAREAEGVVS